MGITRVASVHWSAVSADRSNSSGVWKMPAVALGAAPAILTITDKIQRDEGPYNASSDGTTRQKLRYEVKSEHIAADLVHEWTETGLQMNGEQHPGIWVVRDRLPIIDEKGLVLVDDEGRAQMRDATQEERAAMWAEDLERNRIAQSQYAHAIWNFWNGKVEATPAAVTAVPKTVKDAARYYGFTAEWFKDPTLAQNLPCPHCTRLISPASVVCEHCTRVVNIAKYAQHEAELKRAVTEAVKDNKAA